MARLERFNFHATERPEAEHEPPPAAAAGFGAEAAEAAPLVSDEAAARHFIGQVLAEEGTPVATAIVAPERPEVVPDLRLVRVQQQPETESTLVRFSQTKESVPVFGGHVVCELSQDQQLLTASGEVGEVGDVSTIATVSQADAIAGLAKQLGVEGAAIEGGKPPELQLFPDKEDDWHLVWLFRNVPVAAPEFNPEEDGHGHGLGRSPRDVEPHFDYLVDAHEGGIVYSYPSAPTLMPTYASGETDEDVVAEFYCQASEAGGYEMRDPLRMVVTCDLELGDIDAPALGGPVAMSQVDVGGTIKAAVSAHSNAGIVDDFFRGVLKRNGIDNKGMELVNVVNCTYSQSGEPTGVWHNAVWWENRMWYGQAPDGSGVTRSFARYLDVIAHELTHGVTSNSAGLVYRDQSGALNESYSDIFGIAVKNWDRNQPDTGGDVSTWNWELGAGLGSGGGPLRDLSNPRATGDPEHMSEYLQTNRDNGGVHTNSNIHNKAAYNVFTATEDDGSPAFTPYQASLLFYLALGQLGKLSNFKDSLTAVINAASSLWQGQTEVRDKKVAAIKGAYAAVGIS